MANKERGEVDLVARGKTYTLAITTNGACELEAASGRKLETIFRGARERSIVDMRWMIWGALQEHHGDEIKTPKDAGEFLDDAGASGWTYIFGILKALEAANADKSTDRPRTSGGAAGPLHAQDDATGSGSTLTLVASA